MHVSDLPRTIRSGGKAATSSAKIGIVDLDGNPEELSVSLYHCRKSIDNEFLRKSNTKTKLSFHLGISLWIQLLCNAQMAAMICHQQKNSWLNAYGMLYEGYSETETIGKFETR